MAIAKEKKEHSMESRLNLYYLFLVTNSGFDTLGRLYSACSQVNFKCGIYKLHKYAIV